MTAATAFRLTQGFYWLFLGIWVGAMIMLAISAATTFRTVREYKPILGLAPYNHPALVNETTGILAGGITGNVLHALRVLQTICAVVVAACVVLQVTKFTHELSGGVAGRANTLRMVLIVIPIAVLVIDSFIITPKVWDMRRELYKPELTLEYRESARAVFQRYHKLDERLVGLATLSLIAAVIISPFAFRLPGQTLIETATPPAGKDVARG